MPLFKILKNVLPIALLTVTITCAITCARFPRHRRALASPFIALVIIAFAYTAAASFGLLRSASAQDRGQTTSVLQNALNGRVQIVDGETVRLRGQRLRIWGVDAFESAQTCKARDATIIPCGTLATQQLATIIGDKPISCIQKDTDRYKRPVVQCNDASGNDIGRQMILSGWALVIKSPRILDYVPDQNRARIKRVGVHDLAEYEHPADFRRRNGIGAR